MISASLFVSYGGTNTKPLRNDFQKGVTGEKIRLDCPGGNARLL
jgi:hypothetical protein